MTLNVVPLNLSAISALTPVIKVAAGPAYRLALVDRNIGKLINGVQTVNVGERFNLSVAVLDQDGNQVSQVKGNEVSVTIGLLANEGRGPIFVGHGTNKPSVAVTVKAVNGVATFKELYVDFPGANFILSAGTTNLRQQRGGRYLSFQCRQDPPQSQNCEEGRKARRQSRKARQQSRQERPYERHAG